MHLDILKSFCWHVSILQLRRKHILFVNDLSRLCLVVDGIRSGQFLKLQEKFMNELKEYLDLEGLKKSHIYQYLDQQLESFSKNR
uniref:DUF6933 domain-containing protein n=1 Tax=Paenibacillus athensensis TaxID=1967502 RepID=A0A4Y8QA23_9BACL